MNISEDTTTTTTMSNISGVTLTASPPLRIFGASSYLFFSSLSTVMNSLLITILYKGRKEYKKHAFYLIVWQHVTCDLLTQLIQFIVAIPITFSGDSIYGNGWLLHSLTLFDTIAYNGILYFAFLMTLNRFTVFMFPRLNRLLFEKPRIYITIAFVWGFILAFVALYNAGGCPKYFEVNGFYLYNECGKDAYIGLFILKYYYSPVSAYLPLVMLGAYLSIYAYLFVARFIKNKTASIKSRVKKKDLGILVQSFLICGFLEIQELSFNYLPLLGIFGDGQGSYVLNFAQNWISDINNTVNPIILFTFNAEIRNSLKRLFKGESVQIFTSSTLRRGTIMEIHNTQRRGTVTTNMLTISPITQPNQVNIQGV